MSRTELFLSAVDALQGGHSLEITGDHGSGRTHLLRLVREHFVGLGWRLIDIAGLEAFRRAPLVALSIAGFGGTQDGRTQPLVAAYEQVLSHVVPQRTLIVVDDSDSLDEASWGVISAVSTQLGVPYIATRLRQRRLHNASHPKSGFSTVYAMHLAPMGYAELESALSANLNVQFDEPTMSRIFAMSAGNIGLAGVIVDADRRAGTIVVERGRASARGPLWVPALRAVAEVILQPLDDDELRALKAIAILGPNDIDTVHRVVPSEVIATLESRGVVVVVEAGERRLVTITPPLLSEYFRHDATPSQQAELVAKIDASAEQYLPVLTSESTANALYFRLVHERASIRTLRARQRWATNKTLGNAARLLAAMHADSAHSHDELTSVIEEARTLEGSDEERADWAVVYASHLANYHGRLADGMSVLRQARDALASQRLFLDAHLSVFTSAYLTVETSEPFADVDVSDLPERTRRVVQIARAYWLLVTGRVRDAAALTADWTSAPGADFSADACIAYAHLGMADAESALRLADAGLSVARDEFDAAKTRMYSYLKAISLLGLYRYREAEDAVVAVAGLGLTAGEAAMSRVGLTALEAYFSIRRGQTALLAEYLQELESTGLPEGALPGVNLAFVRARAAAVDGDPAGAAEITRRAGDELWDRGALIAAASTYLYGLREEPTRSSWDHVARRVAQVDCPAIDGEAEFVRALVERDAAALIGSIRASVAAGHALQAQRHASFALAVLADDDGAQSPGVRDELEQLAGSLAALPSPTRAVHLTAREAEVAKLIASGLTNPMIAEALVVSPRTVESHVNKLMKKLGVKRREEIREYLLAVAAS